MKKNKIILVVVAVATVLMFLFLPTFTFHEEGLRGEYHFILSIPADQQVNGPLILVEWLGIILGAAIAFTLTGSPNRKLKKNGNSAENNVESTINTGADSSVNTAQSDNSKQSDTSSDLDRSQK